MTADPTPDELDELLARVHEGWQRVTVTGRPWAVTRVSHAGGRAVTFGAEELGGTGRVHANFLLTSSGPVLRPCEISPERVLEFLRALPEGTGIEPGPEAPTT
jgi:hypothetical protein